MNCLNGLCLNDGNEPEDAICIFKTNPGQTWMFAWEAIAVEKAKRENPKVSKEES
jgi:hypothetical protein